MLYDKARIWVEGGRGGNGCVSFRREAHVPRGGPDGGDGGPGGSVVIVCDSGCRDLSALGKRRHFRAKGGGHGSGARRRGAAGEDLDIRVPPGTVVEGLEGERSELLADGARVTVAQGGSGGSGNKRFASSTRQSPRFAESGLEGSSGWIELRLKLLADVGLVGLPNAGKSSLLARLTRAAPRVGDYPFTTLEPSLGVMELGDESVVLADIPGLIEGAASGAGLGHEFLAHVERCRALVHLIEVGPDIDTAVAAYRGIRAELTAYGHGLEALAEVVCLSKADLLPADRQGLQAEELAAEIGVPVIPISSATGEGLDELRRAVGSTLRDAESAPAVPGGGPSPASHRVYRPGEGQGFEVIADGEGRWKVEGRGIEMLVARHDLSNPEALDYLESRLGEIGVLAELRRAGFEAGDEVVIGEHEFELHPG